MASITLLVILTWYSGAKALHQEIVPESLPSRGSEHDPKIASGSQDLVARKNPIPREKSLEADQGPAIMQLSENFLGPAQIPMASIILDGHIPSLQAQTPVTDEILIKVIRQASAIANLLDFSTGHRDYAGTSSRRALGLSNNTDDSIESKDQEADKKVSKFLELIRDEGYTISKNSIKAQKLNPGTASAQNSKKTVICNVCKCFRGRPSELKYVTLRLNIFDS